MTSQRSAQLKFGGWGIALGAVIVMLIGFTWGGWVTAGTAKENTTQAVLASQSAICVAQFMKAPNYDAQLKAFRATDSWKRSEFISNGGWDKMPGQTTANDSVASACVDGIDILVEK